MSSIMTELKLKDPFLFRQSCYIDGRWVESADKTTIPVDDPATGELIGAVPNMGAAETRRAIEAAAEAFVTWRKRTAKERAGILRRWFDLMMMSQEDLAYLMTLEQGKPLTESRAEVAYAAGNGQHVMDALDVAAELIEAVIHAERTWRAWMVISVRLADGDRATLLEWGRCRALAAGLPIPDRLPTL